ncbi:MAG: restriction endonuclease subunit S [Propionibacteriaceae bacterium]
MTHFKEVTVGELGDVYDGPHATPNRRSTGSKYFLNISSLDNGRLDLSRSDWVDAEDFTRWTRRVQPQESDVLFAYETRLGEVALMPGGVEACLGRRMALIRPRKSVVDPRYLMFAWLSPWFKEEIARRATHGATVSRIPLNDLPNWPFRLPPLAEQQAIAEVLGALDDKIAANQLILAKSDDLLRCSYKRLELSSSHTLSDLVDHNRAQVNAGEIDDRQTYIGLEHVDSRSLWLSRTGTGSQIASAKNAFLQGDVLFGKLRPYFHKVAVAHTSGICSTDILVLRSKQSEWRWLAASAASSDLVVETAVQNSNGTRMPRAKWSDIASCPVPDPGAEAARIFNKVAEGVEARCCGALEENAALAETRDELLPLLMSGRITVKDAEDRVEQEV